MVRRKTSDENSSTRYDARRNKTTAWRVVAEGLSVGCRSKSRKRTPERLRKGGGGLLDGDDDAAIVLAEDIGLDRV